MRESDESVPDPQEQDQAGPDASGREPATADGTDGADREGRADGGSGGRGRRGRARLALGTAVALVLLLIAVLAVPVTRDGAIRLWCDTLGGACPADPLPPISEDEETDWRVRLDPEEAATWGNYIALGDSYSSGDGAGSYDPQTAEPGGCWRSDNAYAPLTAQEFDFAGTLGFFACSSKRGSQMLENLGGEDSQIDRVTPHTSLVTLGIGGNDVGFTPVLRTCMLRMPLLDSGVCTSQEDEVNERMDRFEATLEEILREIRDRAPDARILVLGYPRLFPEEPAGMYYTLTVDDQLWLNEVGRRLNDRIRDTVYRADGEVYGERQAGSVEFVNVFSALSGYEVSAEDAWLNGIVLGALGQGIRVDRATFHPTASGQRSVAERVRLQIVEGPERTVYVGRDTLENVTPELLDAEMEPARETGDR